MCLPWAASRLRSFRAPASNASQTPMSANVDGSGAAEPAPVDPAAVLEPMEIN